MKASKFNIFVDDPETNEAILYNSLYGSLTVWDPDETAAVRRLLADPACVPNDASAIRDALVAQQHLIDDAVDEIAVVAGRKRAGIGDPNRLDVVIMPTMDCNLACTYCYERHEPSAMTDRTEAAIKAWLVNEIPSRKLILLHWYGGEPLLAHPRILSVTREALNIAARFRVACNPHITTNGYLLNRQRIAELIATGIFDYQVTLDGPASTHDQLRVLKNGGATFERIFRNVIELAGADAKVKITLRVNFNHGNLHAIPALLAMFPERLRPQLRVMYEPIFGRCSFSATDNLCAEEIAGGMASYYKLAAELGYDVILGMSAVHTGKLVYCYAERENQVIVNYNGDVFKCSVGTFDSASRVGYLRDDGVLVKESAWNAWTGASLFEERCYACAYLPLCMGGCRKVRLHQETAPTSCPLVPTNASYLLKQIALGRFQDVVRQERTA